MIEDLLKYAMQALADMDAEDRDDLPCELAELAEYLADANTSTWTEVGMMTRDKGVRIERDGDVLDLRISGGLSGTECEGEASYE